MPTRNRQHEIDDETVAAFKTLITSIGWTFTPESGREYGIDGKVEVFEADPNDSTKSSTTGLLFWVQLKGTDTSDERGAKSEPLDVDTHEYYTDLAKDLPVLVVRYHTQSKTFYVKWHETFDPYYTKAGKKAERSEDQKTISFWWNDEDKWSEDKKQSILAYLKQRRQLRELSLKHTLKFQLQIETPNFKGFPARLLEGNIKTALKEKGFIEIPDPNSTSDDILGSITLRGEEISAGFINRIGFTLHLENHEDITALQIISTVLTSIGFTAQRAGLTHIAVVYLQNHFESLYIYDPRSWRAVGDVFLATQNWNLLLNHTKALFNFSKSTENELQAILILIGHHFLFKLRTSNNAEIVQEVEEILKTIYEESKTEGNGVGSASGAYNLGGFYCSISPLKGIHYYNLARKHDLSYLEKAYFHAEVAGLLFHSGKFKSAVRFYRRAIELGSNIPMIKALLADSLMYSGEYEEAKTTFDQYISELAIDEADEQILHEAEWFLKHYILENAIDTAKQHRHPNQALEACNVNVDSPYQDLINDNTAALKLDYLCNTAWFFRGAGYYHDPKYAEIADRVTRELFQSKVAEIFKNPDQEVEANPEELLKELQECYQNLPQEDTAYLKDMFNSFLCAATLYPHDVQAWFFVIMISPLVFEPKITSMAIAYAYRMLGERLIEESYAFAIEKNIEPSQLITEQVLDITSRMKEREQSPIIRLQGEELPPDFFE